jgi:hypothetical protein
VPEFQSYRKGAAIPVDESASAAHRRAAFLF